MSSVCNRQEVVHGLQVAAVVEQRYERRTAALSAQMAAAQKALSAQVAAAQKEASVQQELFTNARSQIASLHHRLSHAQVRV